jgi:hypothetical protein
LAHAPQPFLLLVILDIGSSVFAWASLHHNAPVIPLV